MSFSTEINAAAADIAGWLHEEDALVLTVPAAPGAGTLNTTTGVHAGASASYTVAARRESRGHERGGGVDGDRSAAVEFVVESAALTAAGLAPNAIPGGCLAVFAGETFAVHAVTQAGGLTRIVAKRRA